MQSKQSSVGRLIRLTLRELGMESGTFRQAASLSKDAYYRLLQGRMCMLLPI